MDEHQNHLSSVYLLKEWLQQAAEQRNRHSQPNATSLITPGTLVYSKSHPIGHHKMKDAWDPAVYMVVENMDKEGRVYKLCPKDVAGPENNLNRSELRVLPTAIINRPMTQNQPVPDPGLADDPLFFKKEDEDSNSDGVIITMEPVWHRVQAPSLTPLELNGQTIGTESHSSGTPLSSSDHSQENGPNNVNIVAVMVWYFPVFTFNLFLKKCLQFISTSLCFLYIRVFMFV